MSFHQCMELFIQLRVLCLGNWLHAPLRKKCEEVLVFSIFHPTRLFRPTQLLIWMNFPPYTIIPHCTAIRHFTVRDMKAVNIDTMSWEGLAADRTEWRSALKQHLETGEEKLMAAVLSRQTNTQKGGQQLHPTRNHT